MKHDKRGTGKSRIKVLIFLLFSVLSVLVFLTPTYAQEKNLQQDETFWNWYFPTQMQQSHVPGAIVILIRNGKVVLQKGYGYQNIEEKKEIDVHKNVFRLASISKVITHLGIMQLADEGKLRLDDDIRQYLPDNQLITNQKEPITVGNLLTHTDGFEEYMIGVVAETPKDIVPIKEWLQKYHPHQVLPAGKELTYGNYATILAGHIIENISGMPFDTYMEEHLFMPTGMTHTSFKQPIPKDVYKNLIQEYFYNDGQFEQAQTFYPPVSPHGSAYTTTYDMTTFMHILLNKGNSIVREDTFKEFTAQKFTSHPQLPGITYGFFEHDENNKRGLIRDGNGTGFNTRLYLLPEEKDGIFIYSNSDNDVFREKVLSTFLDHYYPVNEKPLATNGTKETIKELVGSYRPIQYNRNSLSKLQVLFVGMVEVSESNGYLVTQPAGSGETYGGLDQKQQWVEIQPWIFESPDGKRKIAFKKEGSSIELISGSGYHGVYEKAPFYAITSFHLLLASIAGITFLAVIIRSCIFFGRFVLSFFKKGQPKKLRFNIVKTFPFVMVSVNILFVTLLTKELFLSNTPLPGLPSYVFGVSQGLARVMNVSYFIVILTVSVIGIGIFIWMKRPKLMFEKYYYCFIIFAQLLFLWQLYYWNLIGVRI